MFLRYLLFCGCAAIAGACQLPTDTQTGVSGALFSSVPSEVSGITFQNTLTEGLNTNILMYEYFYNGGGVAVGDFNGDSREDIYFTSNMADNKLYLNKGQLKFEDVTDVSGAGGRPGPWKTGVTTVDINADGRLDLYLCYSGSMPAEKRTNQLFVNQGNNPQGVPIFREEAAAYGLASTSFSNQAYFVDYDRDGDLDMLLLNHNPKNLPVLSEAATAELLSQDSPEMGLRLYKNTQQKYEDITTRSGINGSALSYGLGAGVADVNRDGWPDFYISNDYTAPDYLYINQQNGTFRNQLAASMGHTSQFSMGNDIADINNDQWLDIFTLDMLPEDNRRQKLLLAPDNYGKFDLNVRNGFHNQYMRNMLQLNQGIVGAKTSDKAAPTPIFSEVGQLAGVSNTDWSWAALWADYDNDGWKDLYITNGYLRDYTNLDFIKYMNDYVQQRGRLVREDVLEIIGEMPASNVRNYLYQNKQDGTFTNQTEAWGITEPSNSNGAAYADLDNDGDLDLVTNNINQPAFILENHSRQKQQANYLQIQLAGEKGNAIGIGAILTVYTGSQSQIFTQQPTRGYLSSVSPILTVGLGKAAAIDSLHIRWATGKAQTLRKIKPNQRLILREADARPETWAQSLEASPYFREINSPIAYTHPPLPYRDFDRQLLLTTQYSAIGPCMAKADVNADGLEDIFIGGAAGQASTLYLQQPRGVFRPSTVSFANSQASAIAAAVFFDANGDKAPDLYLASGGYHQWQPDSPELQDYLYINTGKGQFSAAPLPAWKASKSCVTAADVNADGHMDLFVGSRIVPGYYPQQPESGLLINNGKGQFKLTKVSLGMVTAARWANLDKVGPLELVVAGEWMPVSVYRLKAGKLEDATAAFLPDAPRGWWTSLCVADLNGDNKLDIVAGNAGLNMQVRASTQEPAELFYGDFDANGRPDPLLSYFIQGKRYPYLTRDELGQQLPVLNAKYNSFDKYSTITTDDLLAELPNGKPEVLTATDFRTQAWLSQPDGTLKAATLPIQAQYGPVYAIEVLDANQDGYADILLMGNDTQPKLRLGRHDATYGTLLLGSGKGHFVYVPQPKSGFAVRGDVRSMMQVNSLVFVGQYGGRLLAFQAAN